MSNHDSDDYWYELVTCWMRNNIFNNQFEHDDFMIEYILVLKNALVTVAWIYKGKVTHRIKYEVSKKDLLCNHWMPKKV